MAAPSRKRNGYRQEQVAALAGVMLPTLFIIIIGLGYGLVYNSAQALESNKLVYIAKDCSGHSLYP